MAKKKWENVLVEVKQLLAESRANLFEAVTRIVAVYDDTDFRAHHSDKIDAMESHLNEFLADFDLTYGEAALILKYYPARDQWRTNSLRTMLAESVTRRDSESRRDAPVRPAPRRIKVEEFEAVQKRFDQESARANSLAQTVQTKDDIINELRQENQRLTRELARAEGRISELERALSRELQAA